MFDDEDLIKPDPLISSSDWFGCDNNCFSENVVPTKNSVEFAFEVEEVVQKFTMFQVMCL